MVEFDSTILPGREGKITAQVKLGNVHGYYKKAITVESNAANEPSMTLYIEGYVEPIIDVIPTYVTLVSGVSLADGPAITLKTKKSDLTVKEVDFEPAAQGGAQGWRSIIPILPTHSVTRSAQPGADGLYVYTVKVSVTAEITAPMSGDLRIKTNHLDKPEVTLHVTINPAGHAQ